MFTIFTIPKAFSDPHTNVIQRNAIQSWINLDVDNQVILVGNDPGVKELANELGIEHIRDVRTNEFNTPMLDSAFALVKEKAKYDILVYANADIILLNDFVRALDYTPNHEFLAVGQRTDLDVKDLIDFKDIAKVESLISHAKKDGVLHAPTGIDYFVFRKKSFDNLPPLAVGRVGWDIWMISTAREKNIPVIDLTDSVLAIHQNHDYPSYNKGIKRKSNPEALKNNSYLNGKVFMSGIKDATWKLTKTGLKKKHLYWIYSLKLKFRRIKSKRL